MKTYHNLKPIYNSESKVLILGTMPSVKSREAAFYYANPQNRFWKIMANLFNTILENNSDKEKCLLDNKIALWDVIKSCDIKGSNDASIKNVVVNNLDVIIKNANIKAIFCTGNKAYKYYSKYFNYDIPCILLPSPSGANARYSLDDLVEKYSEIKKYL